MNMIITQSYVHNWVVTGTGNAGMLISAGKAGKYSSNIRMDKVEQPLPQYTFLRQ